MGFAEMIIENIKIDDEWIRRYNMEMASGKLWGLLLEEERKLGFEQSKQAEQFERERIENIKKRYALLKDALNTGYAQNTTLQRIAELGAEWEAEKAIQYLGGSPFKT